jgi:hypothetical protein
MQEGVKLSRWQQLNKNMKQVLYVVIFIVTFIGGGLWLSNILDFSGRKYYEVDDTWVEDTGVLIGLDRGKYSGSQFTYVYNGKVYSGYSHLNYSPYNSVIGERVVLRINPKFPDKYMPLSWKAVFASDEITDTTTGIITKIVDVHSSSAINNIGQSRHAAMFKYNVYGQSFKRELDIPPSLENASNIKKSATFQIEYLVDNPLRGIMHFDKPR